MHEFFYVEEGTGQFAVSVPNSSGGTVDGKEKDSLGISTVTDTTRETTVFDVSPGSFMHIPPNVGHELYVPEEQTQPMRVLLVGIVVEPKT